MSYEIGFTLVLLLFLGDGLRAQVGPDCKMEFEELTSDSLTHFFTTCDLGRKRLFVTGEHHHAQSTNFVTQTYLQYLMDDGRLKYIFLETGRSFSDGLNKYYQTGDQAYLKWLLEVYRRDYPSYHDLYTGILEYSRAKSLPIQFVGVDVEYHTPGAIHSILDHYTTLLTPEEVATLRSFCREDLEQKANREKVDQFREALWQRLASSEVSGEGAKLLEILRGMEDYRRNWGQRDRLMFEKIAKTLERDASDYTAYFSVGLRHLGAKKTAWKNVRYYLLEAFGREAVLLSMLNYQDCFRLNGSAIKPVDKKRTTRKRYALERGKKAFDLWITVNDQ
ncbi:MAG: hypothetical protein AAF146_02135 [Bacteroidota bacterium]